MKTVTGHWQESTSYSWWMRERKTDHSLVIEI